MVKTKNSTITSFFSVRSSVKPNSTSNLNHTLEVPPSTDSQATLQESVSIKQPTHNHSSNLPSTSSTSSTFIRPSKRKSTIAPEPAPSTNSKNKKTRPVDFDEAQSLAIPFTIADKQSRSDHAFQDPSSNPHPAHSHHCQTSDTRRSIIALDQGSSLSDDISKRDSFPFISTQTCSQPEMIFASPVSPKRKPQPPIVIDLSSSPPPKPTKAFLTFSDMNEARNKKAARTLKSAVDAAWPQPGEVHNRASYLSTSSTHTTVNHLGERSLKLQKGKQSKPRCVTASDLSFSLSSRSPGPDTSYISLPSLSRLDLQPLSSLLPHLTDDPVFQHPLIARLLESMKPQSGGTMAFDHALLLRQHHRKPETLSQLWTQKYAPKRATEMLGQQNIKSAQDLKVWLKHVAVKEMDKVEQDSSDRPVPAGRRSKAEGAPRKPPETSKRVITRKVDRKRKKKKSRHHGYGSDNDSLKDFIVGDDDGDDTIYSKDVNISDFEFDDSDSPSAPEARSPRKTLGSLPFASAQIHQDESEVPINLDQLTNLILLNGPNGSGKTSAVYAVAEELGWDVFELNPGVVRTRKEIDRLVGDVARNHVLPGSSHHQKPLPNKSTPPVNPNPSEPLVFDKALRNKTGSEKSVKSNPFASMMKAAKTKPVAHRPEGLSDRSDIVPLPPALQPSGSDHHAQEVDYLPDGIRKPGARQTLILLDEVDIVYGQDKDFWNAVVDLVSISMRPVVMTCNDVSAVPVDTLPIQKTLEFAPPSTELSSAFMQVISVLEGHLIERETLQQLYEQHVHRYPIDCPINPSTKSLTHPVPTQRPSAQPDLRRALVQLQFWCQWAVGSEMGGASWLDLAPDRTSKMLFSTHSVPAHRVDHDVSEMGLQEQLVHQLDQTSISESSDVHLLAEAYETRSFADAWVDKRAEVQLEHFEDDCSYSKTDEVWANEARVLSPTRPRERITLASASVDREMALEIMLLCHRQCVLAPFDELAFGQKRSLALERMNQATDFLPLTAPLLPASALLTDYGPCLRMIVRADDEAIEKKVEEEEDVAMAGLRRRAGRGLRTSARLSGLEWRRRKLELDENCLEAIRNTGLD